MRLSLKWLMTGNVTPLDERDELLGPQTTISEVKGLIAIAYGFPAKEVLLVFEHVLENAVRLRDIGIVDQASADKKTLTVHVAKTEGSRLESKNAISELGEEDEEDDDDGLMEFTHEDMILAMKMLGKEPPVGEDRLAEMRENAPRAAPMSLRTRQQATAPPTQEFTKPVSDSEASSSASVTQSPPALRDGGGGSQSTWTRLVTVFKELQHGLRRVDADKTFGLKVPGQKEPYAYWDLRLPHEMSLQNQCGSGQIVVEIFFFGEFEPLNEPKFQQQVKAMLETHGIRVDPIDHIREAGCMYPLVAVPILMSVADCWDLGDRVFEGFGTGSLKTSDHAGNQDRAPVVYNTTTGLEAAKNGGQGGQKDCVVM